MVSRTVHVLLVMAGLATLAAACADLTEPQGTRSPVHPRLTLYDPPIDVTVLQRTVPLAAPISASAVIGRGGGTISIPAAGFSISFPANSIQGGKPTLITVTALPGSNVAYEFQPEGLVFHNDPMITQDLKVTAVFGDPSLRNSLEGAYFPDTTYLGNGTARIRETRPTVVDVNGWRMKWNVHHFSGYLASTGRIGGYIGSSGFIGF
ncbi:MAG TPA: hypothetical protein VF541_19955 [Longimicrobium sp.]|jgi:hypothetical protein